MGTAGVIIHGTSDAVLAGKVDASNGSATGLALTTPTIDGELSSATKQQALSALASVGIGWDGLQIERMQALDSALTGARRVSLQALAHADPTGVAPAAIEGGGLRLTDGDHDSFLWVSDPIIQAPKTSHWAIAWRAAYLTPSGTDTYRMGLFGLVNDAATENLMLGEYYSYGDHANMVVMQNGLNNPIVTSVAVANGVMHDWLMVFDGTTFTVQRDGATIAQTTTTTYFPATACRLGVRGVLTHYVDVTLDDPIVGFVRT